MDSRKIVVACVAALVLVAVAFVMSRPGPSDEEAVKRAIRDVADGAREADVGATLKPVSERYSDGNELTRDQLKGLLFREYQRRGPITVMLSEIQVTLAGDIAMAEFSATLADGVDVASFDFLPGDADTLRFVADLEREDGDWRIVGARYEGSRGTTPSLR